MEQTAEEEAEQLVDGVVDKERSRIVKKHNDLINKMVDKIPNFREMNVIFSETRRKLDNE